MSATAADDGAPPAAAGPWARAAALAAFLWSSELLLARLSSHPQDPGDLLRSAAVLAALAFAPEAAARLLPGGVPRRLGQALGAVLLPAFVVAGTLLAPAMGVRPLLGPLLAVGVLGALALWRVVAVARGGPAHPGIVPVAALYAAAILAAWWMLHGALPPWGTVAAVLLGQAALAAICLRPRLVPAAALAGLVVAVWPAGTLEVRWPDPALEAEPAEGPDVVLLCVDTLRTDAARDMRAYRRLAEDGVEFVHAQAASPWTLPSMASALTGLPPWSHGAGSGPDWNYVGMSPEYPTLPELFREAGYDTAALVHNRVVSPVFGFARGFSLWDSALVRTTWALPRTRRTMEARPFAAHALAWLRWSGRTRFYDAAVLADKAESVLAAQRDRPLFLWVHFLDCHFPYRRAQALDAPFARRMELERGEAELYRSDPWWRGAEGVALLKRAYQNEIEAVDEALVRILDALGPPPERGRVVVLFSDHGEEFFEHGDVEHGHALWQELLSVPLVVQGLPGRAAGSVDERLVTHVDLPPTLLAAAGIAPPPGDLGAGFDLAGEGPGEGRAVRSENLLSGPEGLPWNSRHAVRVGRWKLIYGPGGDRVFDLEEDPGERRDLSAGHGALLDRHRERPERVPRSTGGADAGAQGRRLLQGMGYVDF